MLLEKKADVTHVDNSGCTALFYAVDYEPIVALLLDKGASLTTTDKDGATVLHAACVNGTLFYSPSNTNSFFLRRSSQCSDIAVRSWCSC